MTESKKILLVDDDNALRQLYAVELTAKGFVVIEAGDGESGLVKAKSETPDLVLLDIMMPKLDGVAMLTRLKQDPETAKIPVVMLTNFGQENLVQQSFSAGAIDYLLKYKITPSEMAEKVDQVLSASSA
jgi:DNA-binding response OmpR family regulator